MRAVLPAHGKDAHRCNGPDPIPVLIHLTMPGSSRRFTVTDDLGGTFIRSIHATLTTAGSSQTEVDAENLTNGDPLLDVTTTIDSGDTTSYSATTPHELDQTGAPNQVNYVQRGDVLEFTATKGTGAAGLEVLVEFGPDKVKVTPAP